VKVRQASGFLIYISLATFSNHQKKMDVEEIDEEASAAVDLVYNENSLG
jgi:hypothetical protein